MKNFLLQSNIWNEYGYDRLIDSIKAHPEANLEIVDIIPFTDTFKQEVSNKPDLCFGSNRFVDVCRTQGYPTFKSFPPIDPFYPSELWINGKSETMTWKELREDYKFEYDVFVKPYREKFFTGLVISSKEDLDKIQLATSFVTNEDDEKVIVSDAVRISQEARFYVIGGQLISGSVYKVNGQAKQFRVDASHDSYHVVRHLLTDYGSVDDAFVVDVGLMNGAWFIVELNNINSAGLYQTDTDAIVNAFIHL